MGGGGGQIEIHNTINRRNFLDVKQNLFSFIIIRAEHRITADIHSYYSTLTGLHHSAFCVSRNYEIGTVLDPVLKQTLFTGILD
jgi:hypothetical protein